MQGAYCNSTFTAPDRGILQICPRRTQSASDGRRTSKLIVDAFTGLLYEDNDLHRVRGVQVEAEWEPDEWEQTEVWIYGQPTGG
jgi:hypothetical protein